ncbi:MAG TPA: ribonuclease III [Candidatus Dormibacteraeota bacterium]|jgi:ribonuclease-3
MPRRSRPSARPGTTSRRSSASPPDRGDQLAAADLDSLQDLIGVRLHRPELLRQALTHSSWAHEHLDEEAADNERLEFLGDAVIELAAAETLYRADREAGEGALTLRRAALVSTGALAAAARRIGLGAHLRVGHGVDKAGGRDLDSLLANALEAVFGAIYLDRGRRAAADAFRRLAVTTGEGDNNKGRLQELTQAEGAGIPRYEVADTSGPSHRRRYRVEVWLGDEIIGSGGGSTRRAAEQAAAGEALATRTNRGNAAMPASAHGNTPTRYGGSQD